MELLTVGHSTHALGDFLALLRGAGAATLADVRRHPGSRRHPQFGGRALEAALVEVGLGYRHLPELGGRRTPAPGSSNDGWRVTGFRGYADHLRSEEFAAGQATLERLAREGRTVVMCAEAQWWRCHRRLIADVLVFAGHDVLHLMPDGRLMDHDPPSFAVRADDGMPAYPASGQESLLYTRAPRSAGRTSSP